MRAARRIRPRLDLALRVDRLRAALAEVLAAEVTLVVRRLSPSSTPPAHPQSFCLETSDRSVEMVILPEPALATLALARVLERAPAVTDPSAPLTPAARGALGAIAVESARRAGGTLALRARSDAPTAGDGVQLDATLMLDDRPYGVTVWARESGAPTATEPIAPDLASLGGIPLRLPLVGAASVGSRSDLSSLRPGDVWLPDDGWLHAGPAPRGAELHRLPLRRAALSSPEREHGVAVGCSDDGRLVLRGDIIALGADVESESREQSGDDEAMSQPDDTLKGIALDAPIVVRVEVGSVTLTAREWAQLRPGDVLETGLRLAEPAVLRVAGREVARGELVSIDGDLGVRIREIGEEHAR